MWFRNKCILFKIICEYVGYIVRVLVCSIVRNNAYT